MKSFKTCVFCISSLKSYLLANWVMLVFFSLWFQFWAQLLVKFQPTVESAILGIQSKFLLGPSNQCSHQIQDFLLIDAIISLIMNFLARFIMQLMPWTFSKLHCQNNSVKNKYHVVLFICFCSVLKHDHRFPTKHVSLISLLPISPLFESVF